MAVETARQREGIRNFFDVCWHDGLSSETTYRYYISGLDSKGHSVPVKDHLSRGGSLLRLTEAWLDTWEPRAGLEILYIWGTGFRAKKVLEPKTQEMKKEREKKGK